MSSGDGKDHGDCFADADDVLRSPSSRARSDLFGRFTLSGVVHHIVNKFSGVVPKTLLPPLMTGAGEDITRNRAAIEEGGKDQPSEWTGRNDTQALSLSHMNQRGVSPEWDLVNRVSGRQPDVRLSVREDGRLRRPTTPGYKRAFPQFRKESGLLTKSASDVVIHSPSYVSLCSGPVGQMPTVRLSPRQQPLLLRNEDRAKPVMVKIAQLDPLHAPFIRHRTVENADGNNESIVDAPVLTENVVDALKKRKRSHVELDENQTRDLERSFQLSKRRCSREEETSAPDTTTVRGLKRPALRDGRGDMNETSDCSPDVVEGVTKKMCQNLSPQSRRFGCGARNVIDASYSSHQRWEERMGHAKILSKSRAASSQDESMPLVEDSRATSSRTSRCSSRFSRMSRPNSPAQQSEDYRSYHRSDRAHSTHSSGCSTPFNLLPHLHDVDSAQRPPLLIRDGSVKNRVTTLNVLSSSASSSPLPDFESQMSESRKLKSQVEFTADDLERDRDLLNSRASRLMLGFLDSDEQTEKLALMEPSSSTSGFVLGQASTSFQASGTASVSTAITAGAKDNVSESQTSTNYGIKDSNVLKPGSDDAYLLNSSAVLQNSSIPEPTHGGLGSIGSSASPPISLVTVNSTGTLATTQGSFGTQLNCGKSLGTFESGLKESGAGTSTFGTFLAPSSTAADVTGLQSSSNMTGFSFGIGAARAAAISTTTATLSDFGSTSDTKPTTATTSAFLGLGGTREMAGSYGNAVTAAGSSAFDSSAVATTNSATAAKDNAQVMAGGFALGKLSCTQTAAENLGSAKQLIVTSEKKANGLSFGSSSTAQTTASSFSYGNLGVATINAGSFAFENSGFAPTASSFAFGNLGNTQTTASSFAFGNSGNTQTTASSFVLANNPGAMQTTASSFAFGNSGNIQTTASSFMLANSGSTQTTAGGFAFGKSGSAQTTASSFAFGNSGNTQTTASGFAFRNSDATQTAASSFVLANSGSTQTTANDFAFGNASTNLTTGNLPGSVQTASSFAFGNTNKCQTVGVGLTFGNSGNAQATGSSFAGLTAAPQFGFGSSSTTSSTVNPSTASGFALGKLQQPQPNGSNLTTANPFGIIVNTFGSNSATANAFGSNSATANAFGGNLATANAFGSIQGTSNPFSSSMATASPFGGSAATASSFGKPKNNLDNKPLGLLFNRPDVAATNPSTPQDLRRVLFPATPASIPTSGSTLPTAAPQQQPATGFNFFGSKTDGHPSASNSSVAFTFGKNSTSAPAFGSSSTAGGFAFGKTTGGNPSQPVSQGFNFQGATQLGTNTQTPNTGFNFNATTPNFAFGQMPNASTNGLPSIASISAGPKFTPGATYGGSSTMRSLRMKKKGR